MNDTPQGDGNLPTFIIFLYLFNSRHIRINDTLQGDGNLRISSSVLKEYLFVHKNE